MSGVTAQTMIDLHCHLLPGIDDGAADLSESLAMAEMAVEDGIGVIACTPHIFPGLYQNAGPGIRGAIASLQAELDRRGILLGLVEGADIQLASDMLADLRAGALPTLNGSRYFLFEPPHHTAPALLERTVFEIHAAGYEPIITHPERLSWIETDYPIIKRLFDGGIWMQITAGSVTGAFGRRAVYWSERLLDEGMVHILATDAQNCRRRTPILSRARDIIALRVGDEAALSMVSIRPRGILDDQPPLDMPDVAVNLPPRPSRPSWTDRLTVFPFASKFNALDAA